MLPTANPHWLNALRRLDRLTAREHEVFVLMAQGCSNQDLADLLVVSERTIRAHLTQIMAKLELVSRLEASLASYVYGHEIADDPAPWIGKHAAIQPRHRPETSARTVASDNGESLIPT